jgi:hypothetical protein
MIKEKILILPLLCDTDAAKEATPEIILPQKRFIHPEDALWHIENAVSYYENRFGVKPSGMWPSEGSLSNTAVELISGAGIKWTATDEAVLFNSMKDISNDRRHLFKPFQLNINGKNLNIIFRDHGLSDSIGFVYSKWNPQDAANDFITKIKNIGNYASSLCDAPLVSVILDGDNCWEYYKNDGWDFLTALYEKLSVDEDIETVRVSEYLAKFPPKDIMTNLMAGSWINGNFGVWIGSSEDNKSWDCLSATRDALSERLKSGDLFDVNAAWNALHAAEGSDWNWWYGGDHSSLNDTDFDFLYRQQLIKAYKSLGMVAPETLFETIGINSNQKYTLAPPVVISPKIDGKVSDYEQWSKSSFYKTGTSGATMHQVSAILKSFNYGFDTNNLYLKIDFNEKSLTNISLKIIFLKPIEMFITLSFNLGNEIVVLDGQGKILNIAKGIFSKSIELVDATTQPTTREITFGNLITSNAYLNTTIVMIDTVAAGSKLIATNAPLGQVNKIKLGILTVGELTGEMGHIETHTVSLLAGNIVFEEGSENTIATLAYEYEITVSTIDAHDVVTDAYKVTDGKSLNNMNVMEGDRALKFSFNSTTNTYYHLMQENAYQFLK